MISVSTIFDSIIRGNGYSLTQPRALVFEALSKRESLTMAELVTHLSGRCDRASIYRTIELFEALNIVNRVPVGWKYKLELSTIFRGHHHHAVCLTCERVIEFQETDEIEHALAELASVLNFTISEHNLELQGYCSHCRQLTA